MSGALPPLPDKARLLDHAHRARLHWGHSPRPAEIEVAGPGEESVWDFPRPPLVRPAGAILRVEAGGLVIAETSRGITVCETAGAPVHYFAPDDVRTDLMTPTDYVTICEWKGAAVHYDLAVGNRTVARAAYSYPDPLDDLHRGFATIAGWFAFYPALVACFADDERATPQPGGYYGGWVRRCLRGPIKGGAGSEGW
ncbi:MAG: DUF427 domain-containing protein [Pseudomonadota bacterium]